MRACLACVYVWMHRDRETDLSTSLFIFIFQRLNSAGVNNVYCACVLNYCKWSPLVLVKQQK